MSEQFKEISYNPSTGTLHRVPSGKMAGTVCTDTGYIRFSYKNKNYLAHRVAWYLTHGEWPEQIDHINRDRSDNKIENLRAVTYSQQSTNKVGWGASGKKGVYFHKGRGKWHARVHFKSKCHHVGYYDNLDEAKHDYDKKAKELHGEYHCGEHRA